jgi:hypothetical protein
MAHGAAKAIAQSYEGGALLGGADVVIDRFVWTERIRTSSCGSWSLELGAWRVADVSQLAKIDTSDRPERPNIAY